MPPRDSRALPLSAAQSPALTTEQRIAWLRLIRSENVGPVTFRELVNQFGGATEALAALPTLSRRGGRHASLRICRRDEAEAELDAIDRLGAQLVALGETGYPPWLARIDAPPPVLCIKGQLGLVSRPIISIVGSRNGSAAGQKIARTLAADLGKQGFVIASGLARGIDAAAHRAALETGTIAVLAGGVDIIYPPEHADLHRQIAQQGLLICERPPGLDPRAQDFPRRNRLISGMAAGLIVVEAARRSGSLITARFAAEQGREVFAVPGNPLDPRAEGTNGLLKNGATLVTHADDVVGALEATLAFRSPSPAGHVGERDPLRVDELFDMTLPDQSANDPAPADMRARIIQALGAAPIELDEIARATGCAARDMRVVLLELDLAGRIEHHPGNMVSLMPV
jgi:DNA processing protein